MSVPVRNTSRSNPEHDYLKYWRVVKYWAKRKYDITTGDLELMLFYIVSICLTKLNLKSTRNCLAGIKINFMS